MVISKCYKLAIVKNGIKICKSNSKGTCSSKTPVYLEEISWVLLWVMPHPSIKVHGNLFSNFCAIMLTNKMQMET